MRGQAAFRHIDTLDLLAIRRDSVDTLEFIDNELPGYTALTSLTVCPWHLEDVMKGLHSLKDQGRAPVHLDTVYTIVSDNERIPLDYSTGEKLLLLGRLDSEYLYRSHSLSEHLA